jgi:hypothetical protein
MPALKKNISEEESNDEILQEVERRWKKVSAG